MIGKIQYGTVTLLMCWCELSRRPIRTPDDTTFLFNEYVFDVLCTFNNSATSVVSLSPGDYTPNTNKSAPGRTDIALREYLAQPRRQLIVWYGDDQAPMNWQQPFLISPPDTVNAAGVEAVQPSDAANGPVCEVLSIKEHDGVKTWIMHLQFKTWVSCQDAKSPILAHRFRKVVDIDSDYFATIVTTGEVTFDVGRLWAANQSPDFYRSQFWAAPPGNFKRTHINVEVSEDNATAKYTVIDSQQAFNLGGNSPATRIEAFLTTDYQQGSMALMLSALTESSIGLAYDIAINPAWGNFDPFQTGVALGAQFASGMTRNTYAAVKSVLPKYWVNIKVRAWGSSGSKRLDLFNMCMAVAIQRLGAPDFFFRSNNTQIMVSQEVTGKFIELDMTFRYTDETLLTTGLIEAAATPGGAAALATFIAGRIVSNGALWYGPFISAPEDMNNIMLPPSPGVAGAGPFNVTQNPIGNRPPGGIPAPGVANPNLQVRGEGYLQKLIVEGLSGQCQNPPVVGVVDPSVPAA